VFNHVCILLDKAYDSIYSCSVSELVLFQIQYAFVRYLLERVIDSTDGAFKKAM
jgi:hypothetical protein